MHRTTFITEGLCWKTFEASQRNQRTSPPTPRGRRFFWTGAQTKIDRSAAAHIMTSAQNSMTSYSRLPIRCLCRLLTTGTCMYTLPRRLISIHSMQIYNFMLPSRLLGPSEWSKRCVTCAEKWLMTNQWRHHSVGVSTEASPIVNVWFL